MPYIHQSRRNQINSRVNGHCLEGSGELNYAITKLIQDYLPETYPSYGAFNEAIGALECAKLELYRRQVAVFEDMKRDKNGEVFTTEIRDDGSRD